ncbi:MAG: PQQ-binding-like beta-propeller repeat protein, partial [Planctomycetota bacterium]|nr:PQQ-binding-like beta-propeller repeat protein [Planctomycetota bacterium]
IDRETGKVVWQREAPRDRVTAVDERNSPASPSAAVDADTVVVFFEDSGLLAYDHDGKQLWHRPLGPFDNVYGMGASPVLVGDRAILACDQNTGSFVIAVSKKDGEVLWRRERPEATSGHCTPILYEPDTGGRQLILPGSFLLDAYDVATGEKAWFVRGLSFEMKSVPVLHDGVVFINGYGSPFNEPGQLIEVPDFAAHLAEKDADGDGRVGPSEMPAGPAGFWFEFVDLDADGALDGKEWAYLRAALASRNGLLAIRAGGEGDRTGGAHVWSYRRAVPQLPSPLIYDDVLYMLNDQGGLLTTFRPKDGEIIQRGRLEQAVDDYYASPVAGDGKIYLVSRGGIVTVLPAGGGLEPLATNELDESCYATPALEDGRIYLRTTEALYCFGI